MNKQDALRRLQATELEILEVIADFCSCRNIRWWLDGGTCLGAMRHGGFIPWDDDIDIGMLREDYDYFCELAANGLPTGYSLHTANNTNGYAPLFAKVYKDGTCFENRECRDAGHKMGIFVDIFPYDRLYLNSRLRNKQIAQASIAQKRSYLYHSSIITVPHRGLLGVIEKTGCRVLHYLERVCTKNPGIYQRQFDSCIPNSLNGEVSNECLTLCWPNMSPFPISDIFPLAMASFEQLELPVPRLTDSYLSTMYGDWHEIPAPEYRHTHLPLLLDFGDGEIWESGD